MSRNRFFSVSAFLALFAVLSPLFPFARMIPAGAGELLTMVLLILPVQFLLLGSVLIPAAVFRERLPFRHPNREDLRYLATVPLMFIGLSLINGVLSSLLRRAGIQISEQAVVQFALHCSSGTFAFLLFSTVLLAPVAEELVFRFAVCGFLRQNGLPEKWTAVLTSLVFALMHGLVHQSLGLFLLGLYLQKGADSRKGGVTRSILMHSLYNLCGLAAIGVLRIRG